jgi:hypothetical protein
MAKTKTITKGKKRKGVGAVAKRPVGGRVAHELQEPADEVGELPCPVTADPAMGDKTPGVMAWYREYRPEEFKRRYGNRVCPDVDGAMGLRGGRGGLGDEGDDGPVSDFEDEEDEVVVKPRVIMG